MTDQTDEVVTFVEPISNEIIDKLGRVITLKEIGGKKRIEFFRALGIKDCQNFMIVSEFWNVMAVDKIDGTPQGTLKQLVDIEAIYSKLENGQALPLITEWLNKKEDEKKLLEASEDFKNAKK